MKKKGYSLLSVIIIVVITAIISGLTIGTILTKNSYLLVDEENNTEDENLQEFLDLYSRIKDEYYDNVDSKTLIDGAISGMLNEIGEDYTTLLDEENATSLLESLNGTYEGIGITIKDHAVYNTVVGSSAEKAGILPGDVILSINGSDVTSLSSSEISALISSNKEMVNLVINRDGTNLTFNLKVETLNVPAVSYNKINDTSIGYMRVSVFSSNVSNEIETALKSLKNSEINGLIVDLRGNNGGYLDEAYKSASLFTKKDTIIYSLESKNNVVSYKDNDNKYESLKIIILINKGTASSAEVLASALKYSYGATIVGKTSYGKGKVQHTYTLSNGSIAKYTSSKWLTPEGNCIDGIGLIPDYDVDNLFIYEEGSNNTIVTGINDLQYDMAVKLLSQ